MTRRVLVVLGGAAMGYDDVSPCGVLVCLIRALVAHDAVLLPLAIGVGVLIGRYVPPTARPAVRAAAVVSLAVLVVATALVLGFGRRPGDPSALPLPSGRGLAVTLGAAWMAAALTVAARIGCRRGGRRELSGPGDPAPVRPTDAAR